MNNKWVIASFSGGKDSTAMVLRMIEKGEQLDEVICCDTYKEFPAMYRHIERVRKVVEEAGVKFTVLRSEKSFDYYMFDHIPKRRMAKYEIEYSGFSWATPKVRWCTSRMKKDVIKKYLKDLFARYKVTQCVGIAADEEYRLKRKNNQEDGRRHPLVEWGWNEEKCLEYCYKRGFDWEGLYEIFRKEKGRCPRVSCWCCPLQSLEDLRILRKNFPDLWEELRNMDKRTWRTFTFRYTVEELEQRFAFEEERIKQGLPIRGKNFFEQLNERLNRNR